MATATNKHKENTMVTAYEIYKGHVISWCKVDSYTAATEDLPTCYSISQALAIIATTPPHLFDGLSDYSCTKDGAYNQQNILDVLGVLEEVAAQILEIENSAGHLDF